MSSSRLGGDLGEVGELLSAPDGRELSCLRGVREDGLKETLRKRDEPFGEGFARVGEPEGRSEIVRAARED